MRITKISVKGLFGMFDHEIPLNQESRITIVHGPNGVGKTVLLGMVHGLFHYRFKQLHDTPFEQLRIEFENCASLRVAFNTDEFSDNYRELEVDYCGASTKYAPKRIAAPYPDDIESDAFETGLNLVRTGPSWGEYRFWWDKNINRVFSEEMMVELYPQLLGALFPDGEIQWFEEIMRATDVRLIETTRLRHGPVDLRDFYRGYEIDLDDYDEDNTPQLSIPSHELALYSFSEYVKRKFDDSRESQVKTLKSRLSTDFEEVLESLKAAADYMRSLSYFGTGALHVFDDLEDGIRTASNDVKSAIEDSNLELDEPEKRRSTFEDIINDRFLFKSITIDSKEGLKIVADDGSDVHLTQLSSGEQHMLLLYFELLFETQPDTLVMIDEPEISLNVVWQRRFLNDLQRIVELCKFDVLIATHSPQIIHDKWDWMVPLGEKVDD